MTEDKLFESETERWKRNQKKLEAEYNRDREAYFDVIIREGECMTKATFNRILDHIQQMKEEPFALITAFVPKRVAARELGYVDDKGEPDPKALPDQDHRAYNNKHQSKLIGAVMKDYSFIQLEGWYEYEDGHREKEESLFVIGIPPQEALRLGNRFNQESVLVGSKDGIQLILCKESDPGKRILIGQTLQAMNFKKGYSVWRNRPFSFQPKLPDADTIKSKVRTGVPGLQKKHGGEEYFEWTEDDEYPKLLGLGVRAESWGMNYLYRDLVSKALRRRYSAELLTRAFETGDVSILRR